MMENGVVTVSDVGSPQGSVISPLLSNIYLHHVFDTWAHEWRQSPERGCMIVVRYADDFVCGFERETDARAFLTDLKVRMETYGLSLHPEKTRLIEFGRHASENREKRGVEKPETFTFLGFTHICGKSRKGTFLLVRKSRSDRKRNKIREIKEQLRRRINASIPEQGKWLGQVVRGYFAYHAIPTNIDTLQSFRHHVARAWLRVLQRRSQRTGWTWEKMTRLAGQWLPMPRILHPWPNVRFAVTHPR